MAYKMTNQLARMVLNELRRNKETAIYSEIQIKEALSMGIDALDDKDKPCKTCRYNKFHMYDTDRRCAVPCDFCTKSENGRMSMYVK